MMIEDFLNETKKSFEQLEADKDFQSAIQISADLIFESFSCGKKLLICGNGGSAADSQHIAGEFISRLNFDRDPLPAIALTTDTSVITAVGNDYRFEEIFERQVRALGSKGDSLIAISTSGKSKNVLRALEVAKKQGLRTIGFVGSQPGKMAEFTDICVAAPSHSTPIIQQIHITAAHLICGLVEHRFFKSQK